MNSFQKGSRVHRCEFVWKHFWVWTSMTSLKLHNFTRRKSTVWRYKLLFVGVFEIWLRGLLLILKKWDQNYSSQIIKYWKSQAHETHPSTPVTRVLAHPRQRTWVRQPSSTERKKDCPSVVWKVGPSELFPKPNHLQLQLNRLLPSFLMQVIIALVAKVRRFLRFHLVKRKGSKLYVWVCCYLKPRLEMRVVHGEDVG